MTDRKRTKPPANDVPAPVTGVARGSEGTGTALDDTQVYDVNEFAFPEGSPPAGDALYHPDAADIDDVDDRVTPEVAPVALRRPARSRPRRRGVTVAPFVRAAFFTGAVALAVLLGVSLANMGSDGGAVGQELQSFPGASVATLEEPTPEPTKKGKGRGNGNGTGNGVDGDD